MIGLGPVGIMALQCASLFGPARILAVDRCPSAWPGPNASGRSRSTPRRVPGAAQVMEATGGRGAESVIEAVGADATVLDAVSCAASGGTVSIVGVNLVDGPALPDGPGLPQEPHGARRSSRPYPAPGPRSCRWSRRGVSQLAETFTHRMGLSQVAEAYDLFDSRHDGVLKVLLLPN